MCFHRVNSAVTAFTSVMSLINLDELSGLGDLIRHVVGLDINLRPALSRPLFRLFIGQGYTSIRFLDVRRILVMSRCMFASP
jgi:hypothetical protein